jgi:AmmeMemoRadiSam system protein A
MKQLYLTKDEKIYLLDLARKTIVDKSVGRESSSDTIFSASLEKKSGVFVTLHKNDCLRGCIGYVEGSQPLQTAVMEMAAAAAFDDPRFPAVKADEVTDLQIEISVLSPLQTIFDINEIETGRHGLIIEKGLHRGLLLPQVASEYGWNTIEFLEQTCIKAGLTPDSWKEDDLTIKIFSAEIFSEADF